MKPTIDLYCGAPIEIQSERIFVRRLIADLLAKEHSALIFANFFPHRNPHQIDFLVVTECCACHIELKAFAAPVSGGINGPWALRMPDGTLRHLDAKNPYRQALDGKHALSDEMHVFCGSNTSVPRPTNGKFYKSLESVVCVYPELLPGSSVYQDHKVRVLGYSDLLTQLTNRHTNPGWTKEHWLDFAMHLSLIREEDEGTHSAPELGAAKMTQDYLVRFERYYGNLPAIIPAPVVCGTDAILSNSLHDVLLVGKHFQLVGPSGCGKSLLAKKMALVAAAAGRISIVVPAKEYDGKLSALLDRSVAHLCPDTAIRLLKACLTSDTPFALIIDGFNECPPKLKENLVKDLQAFYLRYPCPIVITSQEPVPLREALSGVIARFGSLDASKKAEILKSYVDPDTAVDEDRLSEPFQTPYELSLVAECLAELGADCTRVALFDAYIRRRCKDSTRPALARQLLCAIARRMKDKLVSSLPLIEVWQLAVSYLRQDNAPSHVFTQVLQCGLLEVRQGRCAFRHEQLQRFLQAEGLVAHALSHSALGELIALPRNRPLVEFVVQMSGKDEHVHSCLRELSDPKIIEEALRGHYGEHARDVATDDCCKVLYAADRALEDQSVELVGMETTDFFKKLIIRGGPIWTPYEISLLEAIGKVLADGLFLESVFTLVANTDERCRSCLIPEDNVAQRPDLVDDNSLFAALYVYHASDGHQSFPASIIFHAARFNFSQQQSAVLQNGLLHLAPSLHSSTPGQLALFCELLRNAPKSLYPVVPHLLRACWNTRLYHLRLDALQLAQCTAGEIDGAARAEVVEFLSTIQTGNVFLSTAHVDALLAYGLVTSPVDVEQASAELVEILGSPDEHEAQERAYHAITNIFEDIYEGAYWNAIEKLSTESRTTLYIMAGRGAPTRCLFADWLVQQLVELDDARTLPILLRWTSELPSEAFCPQEAVGAYIWAMIGCARYLDSPPRFSDPHTENERAWEEYGAIVFWMHKPDVTLDQRNAECRRCWNRLCNEFPFEAVDPLTCLERTEIIQPSKDRRILRSLCESFPNEVREILEFGLANRTRLTSLFRGPPLHDRAAFVIRWLGIVGNRHTARMLQSLIDDDVLGSDAFEALSRLNAEPAAL